MIESINVNIEKELVFVDHHLFTEFLELTGNAKQQYRHFLKNILPQFLKDCKKEKPAYCLYLPEFAGSLLIEAVKKDEELERIVSLYSSHKFIKQFGTEEKDVKAAFSLKEEQVFYKTLLDDVRSQDMTKDILFITGHNHAKQNGDGLVDAGIARVGCFSTEEGYIEYKIVEPKQDDVVFIEGKPIKLGKKMTAGGEATIFHLGEENSDFIAKIYCTSLDEKSLKPNCVKFRHLMQKRTEKLEDFFLNTRYEIRDSQLIFPLLPIYDQQGVLIGVVMKKVKNGNVPAKQLHDIIMNDSWPFEGFNRLDLLNIAHQIVKKVKKVHDHGIIIGDINLRNFLVTGNSSETLKVYLIDLDGCQIEGHPSYYETPNYRDPLWDITSNQPRTVENEVYTLLVLLFEVIHLGVHPFSYTGGLGRNIINDCQLNMQNRDFPYVKGKPVKNARGMFAPPEAKFIFSHMPKSMCTLFRETFGQNESGVCDYRPTIEEVIEKVEGYIQDVREFSGNNQLRFTNYGMPKKHRVEFECSHKNCKGKIHYRHINEILTRIEKSVNRTDKNGKKNGEVEKYLFCGDHLQNYHRIRNMEKKARSKEEKMEFRKVWQAQHEERDIIEIVNRFFLANPNHELREKWETLKSSFLNLRNVVTTRPLQSSAAAQAAATSTTASPTAKAINNVSRNTSSKNEEKNSILSFLNSLFK